MGPVSATVDTDSKKISITAEAYFYAGAICREMIVGFTKAVELPSHVRPGSYDVVMTGNTAAPASKLLIGRSTRLEADDYLYASAHSIDVTTPFVGGAEIVLRGQHPHVFQGCVKFVETKTSISEDVIVVQPITRISNDDNECAGSVNNRFEERVQVPALTRGEYVVHVRTLDGNSLNHFFIAE